MEVLIGEGPAVEVLIREGPAVKVLIREVLLAWCPLKKLVID